MTELTTTTLSLSDLPESATDADKLTLQDLLERITSVPEGLEGDYRWRPSRLKLQHPTTSDPMVPADGRPGDYFSDGEVVYDARKGGGWPFIPLIMWTSHALFADGQMAPTCSSDDGRWARNGLSCERCPNNPAYEGSPCRRSHEAVVLAADLSNIYQINFSKSSYAAGTALRKFMQVPRAGDKLIARLGSEAKKNTEKNSTYYIATMVKGSDERTPVQQYAVNNLRPFISSWRSQALAFQADKRADAAGVFQEAAPAQAQIETVKDSDGFQSDM